MHGFTNTSMVPWKMYLINCKFQPVPDLDRAISIHSRHLPDVKAIATFDLSIGNPELNIL